MTQTRSAATAPEEVLPDMDRRFEAAVSVRDAAALAAFLPEDFVYSHSDGRHEAKSVYIEGVVARSAMLRQVSDTQVEVHGDVAVTRGNVDFVYPDGRPTRFNRYAHIYRLRDGRWQLISHGTFLALDRAPSKG